MKLQRLLCILFLLLIISICCACSADSSSAVPETAATVPEDSANLPETASKKRNTEDTAQMLQTASELSVQELTPAADAPTEKFEDVTGIFEGLEGNHTAVFSFNGIETAFHFEEPAVRKVLFEAVAGSTYILSYYFDSETGLYTIYEIKEA